MAEEVIGEILWTSTAKTTFNNIVEHLRKHWTEKEIEKLVDNTTELIANIRRFPEMCRPSTKRKNVRIGILDKHTQLVYHYKPRKKQIVILLFWGFKQNPAKFKY
jgi:plasmid stabilization system protein ParE